MNNYLPLYFKKKKQFIFYCFFFLLLVLLLFFLFYENSKDKILEENVLRVVVVNEPDTVFQFNKQYDGFEYQLLLAFVKDETKLNISFTSYNTMLTKLNNGDADLAIGGIIDTPYLKKIAQPTIAWYKAKTTVVYPRGTQKPKNIKDFSTHPVFVGARYQGLKKIGSITLTNTLFSEYQLLKKINQGKIRYALITNHRAKNSQQYFPYINRSYLLENKAHLVWLFSKKYDPALLDSVNQFLNGAINEKLPEKLINQYLLHANTLNKYDTLRLHKRIRDTLPQLKDKFAQASKEKPFHWNLLAAISYQESRWSNDAVSPTGVRGIMQITENTAAELGVSDRLHVAQNIHGGAKYLSQLHSRLPNDIPKSERIWFAIAAYNLGLKHIRFAYKKAKKNSLDHTKWSVISQLLPTLYDEPFDKGKQAQKYVQRIQAIVHILRFYDWKTTSQKYIATDKYN